MNGDDTMENEEIKECPFCKNNAQIITKKDYLNKKTKYSIRCITSKCFGHPKEPIWFDSKAKAIKTWNKR
jgi:hypothetical protein